VSAGRPALPHAPGWLVTGRSPNQATVLSLRQVACRGSQDTGSPP
jgi:hypothetical protein